MRTEIAHAESWAVTITREGHDDWPPRQLLKGTKTRYMHPDKIRFVINRGDEELTSVVVSGDRIDDPGPRVASRFPPDQAPEWVQEIVDHERQAHRLGPGVTGAGW